MPDTLLDMAFAAGDPPQELAFSSAEYKRRVDRVTQGMRERSMRVLISAHLPNMCYLTGYQFTNCDYAGYLVLHDNGRAAMVVPSTEVAAVLLHGWVRDIHHFRSWRPLDAVPLIRNVLAAWGVPDDATVGVEMGLELTDAQAYEALVEALPQARFEDASDLCFPIRAVKTEAELAHQRQAARYSNAGMRAAARAVTAEATELDVAAAAVDEMIALGSEFFSTAPTVAAGARSAIPGAMFGQRPLDPDKPVVVELAGVHQRYSVPLARTFFVKEASTTQAALLTATECLDAFLDAVRPHRPLNEAVAAAEASLAELPSHIVANRTFGYGIGVDLPPTWRTEWLHLDAETHEAVLPGMTFYSYVSLTHPGNWGVLVGDSWVCTESGAQRLTACGRFTGQGIASTAQARGG